MMGVKSVSQGFVIIPQDSTKTEKARHRDKKRDIWRERKRKDI
jgi:hypothetical protein